jgi:8-oxo-dGTP pyrophosphatase MutT (NUDIX family)
LKFDPQQLPVMAVDDHLPAVPRDRLSSGALRDRFSKPLIWVPELVAERPMGSRSPVHASVLVPLLEREGGLTVLLTQRAEHLTDHPGQISFPGGRVEPHDSSAVETALREAEEEIGLTPASIEVLGMLPSYTTVTSYIVTPVVGIVQPGLTLRPDPLEVSEIFEVPLAFLMSPAHHRRHVVGEGSEAREVLSRPWVTQAADGSPQTRFIWGATAAMLRNFYRFLSA